MDRSSAQTPIFAHGGVPSSAGDFPLEPLPSPKEPTGAAKGVDHGHSLPFEAVFLRTSWNATGVKALGPDRNPHLVERLSRGGAAGDVMAEHCVPRRAGWHEDVVCCVEKSVETMD